MSRLSKGRESHYRYMSFFLLKMEKGGRGASVVKRQQNSIFKAITAPTPILEIN